MPNRRTDRQTDSTLNIPLLAIPPHTYLTQPMHYEYCSFRFVCLLLLSRTDTEGGLGDAAPPPHQHLRYF